MIAAISRVWRNTPLICWIFTMDSVRCSNFAVLGFLFILRGHYHEE